MKLGDGRCVDSLHGNRQMWIEMEVDADEGSMTVVDDCRWGEWCKCIDRGEYGREVVMQQCIVFFIVNVNAVQVINL